MEISQYNFLQHPSPSKLIAAIFCHVSLVFLLPNIGYTFEKPISAHIQGKDFPYILKSNNFSLNARNVKVLRSQENNLWIGTSMGLINYDTTTMENYIIYDNRNGLLSNGIFSIASDYKNQIWVGSYGGGLSLMKNKKWININTPHGLNDSFVYDQKFSKNDMWIATWSGANKVTGNPFSEASWKSFTVENTNGGLIDNWVYAIEIGKDSKVWFGTEAGLSMYDGESWFNWNHKRGLGAAYNLVAKDNRKSTNNLQGEHHSHQPPDQPKAKPNNYRPNYIVSMLLDQTNRLWIGTWGGGLSQFDPTSKVFRNFTVQDGLPGNYILAIKEGPDGNLWIGSNKGLSRFDGTHFLNFSKINGLISDYAFSIEFDHNNHLWVGGHYGITQLKIHPESGDLLQLDKH